MTDKKVIQTSGKKVDRRVVRTKNSIKRGILELLGEKDIHQITITELAQKANINRKTFYSHYSTVLEPYLEISEEIVDKTFEIMTCCYETKDNNYIYDYIRQMHTILEGYEGFSHALLTVNDQALLRLLSQVKQDLEERWSNHVTAPSGALYSEFFLVFDFIFSGTIAIYRRKFLFGDQVSLDQVGMITRKIAETGMALFKYGVEITDIQKMIIPMDKSKSLG